MAFSQGKHGITTGDMASAIDEIIKNNSVSSVAHDITNPNMPPRESIPVITPGADGSQLEDKLFAGKDPKTGKPLYIPCPKDEKGYYWLCNYRWPNIDMHFCAGGKHHDGLLRRRGVTSWSQFYLLMDAAEPLWEMNAGFCANYQMPKSTKTAEKAAYSTHSVVVMDQWDEIIVLGVNACYAFAAIRKARASTMSIVYARLNVDRVSPMKNKAGRAMPNIIWKHTGIRLKGLFSGQTDNRSDSDILAVVLEDRPELKSGDSQLLPMSNTDPAAGGVRYQLALLRALAPKGKRQLLQPFDAQGMPALLACNESYLVVGYVPSASIPNSRRGLWVLQLKSLQWLQVYDDTVSAIDLRGSSLAYGDKVLDVNELHLLTLSEELFDPEKKADPESITTHVAIWEVDPPSSSYHFSSHEPIQLIYQEPGRVLVASTHNICYLDYREDKQFRLIGRDVGPTCSLTLYGNDAILLKDDGRILIADLSNLNVRGCWDDENVISRLLTNETREANGEPTVRDCYNAFAVSCGRIICLLLNGTLVCLYLPAIECDPQAPLSAPMDTDSNV